MVGFLRKVWDWPWKKLASIATVVGVIAAVASVWIAGGAYVNASRQQAQAEAVNLFRQYLEVTLDSSRLHFAYPPNERARLCDPEYQQFASYALFVAESIYDLSEEGETWIPTLKAIIESHAGFVASDMFPSSEYSDRYQALVRSVVQSPGTEPAGCAKPLQIREAVPLKDQR